MRKGRRGKIEKGNREKRERDKRDLREHLRGGGTSPLASACCSTFQGTVVQLRRYEFYTRFCSEALQQCIIVSSRVAWYKGSVPQRLVKYCSVVR